jgi:hypothetical protein
MNAIFASKSAATGAMVAVLAAAAAGCTTARKNSLSEPLWSDREIRRMCVPASPPKLEIWMTDLGGTLVVYEELREGTAEHFRRSYVLEDNRDLIAGKREPKFLTDAERPPARPTPVVQSYAGVMPAIPENGWFTVGIQDGKQFVLFRDGRAVGTNSLPTYQQPINQVRRGVVAPAAAAGDAVTVGVLSPLAELTGWIFSFTDRKPAEHP